MAGHLHFIKLLFLLLLSNCVFVLGRGITTGAIVFPPTCNRIECPDYEVVLEGTDYEIRRYNSSVWMSTSSIQNISMVGATLTGFLRLFDYIQGKNSYNETIEMTGPVITEVFPSDGPLCESNFIVSFYVPEKNQADPPSADGLHAQHWDIRYVAVRQFGGFATDYNVAEEAAALQSSLSGTRFGTSRKSHLVDVTSTAAYIVAQYNSPFEFQGRINEIWMLPDIDGVANI